MRKIALIAGHSRSLPLATHVVMGAQEPAKNEVMIGGELIPANELVELTGSRNQRRLQRKALLRGGGKIISS